MKQHYLSLMGLGAALLAAQTASAQLRITEVYAGGSGNLTYAADWFELSNFGVSAINLTGWKMDDGSSTFATSVALRGITSIAPGQTVVFLEGNSTGTTDATINASFVSAWFGGSAPSGLTLANYGGTSVGLSTGGDGVSLFDGLGVLQAKVSFSATTVGITFDNAVGLDNTTISQLSVAGVNNAFSSFNAAEIGSPGVVPEPTSVSLAALGMGALIFRRRLVASR